jgi:hypothetical protein
MARTAPFLKPWRGKPSPNTKEPPMALNAENSARLMQIRSVILEGKAPPEERRRLAAEGVRIMREDRVSASHASGASKTKAAAARAVPNTTDILAEMKAKAAAMKSAVIPPAVAGG